MHIDSIRNGIVIDHISAGKGMKIYDLLGLDKLDCTVAIIKNSNSRKMGKKDIIKIDADIDVDLDILGYVDPDSPDGIRIFSDTFANKEEIAGLIEEYNLAASEEDRIDYTDYAAMMMSGISTIIDAITYVLIAFVSVSLVVSSIMIGIITYISVLERTKEIGILRSIGGSKRDISRVFNAETFIVGVFAGIIGIGATVLMTIPINAIIQHLTGITTLRATLPWEAALVLVALSMALTVIAGFVPSKIAAKKDPVVALRTE